MGSPHPHITVVGLGPAGPAFLGDQVRALIAEAPRAFLRTRQHPAAADLDTVASFDDLYDQADTFDEVYRAIVEALVEAATESAPTPVVYAVPGSPLVAERTVELLREDDRVALTVVPALSFLDLAWARLGIDPLACGVRLVDGEQFASQAKGGRGPFLVAQCWSTAILSEIKLAVDGEDEPLPAVTVLHHLGLDDEMVRQVDWWDLDRDVTPDHLTTLYIPALDTPVGAEGDLARLESLVRTLRAECPWDRVQTHASLMPHLVEESYEVLDALAAVSAEGSAAADVAHLQEELGDLLFQIVFHACLAEEDGQFTLAEVARGIHDKLVHRHPHVFGTVDADTPDQVMGNWEAIKKEEKGRASVTEGIPHHLPSLMLTTKLQRKARSVGLPADARPDLEALVRTLHDQAEASRHDDADAPLALDQAATDALVGNVLFEIADLARRVGIDPEQSLRARSAAFRDRIVAAEGATQP